MSENEAKICVDCGKTFISTTQSTDICDECLGLMNDAMDKKDYDTFQ